jgi:hypothetical protein
MYDWIWLRVAFAAAIALLALLRICSRGRRDDDGGFYAADSRRNDDDDDGDGDGD